MAAVMQPLHQPVWLPFQGRLMLFSYDIIEEQKRWSDGKGGKDE